MPILYFLLVLIALLVIFAIFWKFIVGAIFSILYISIFIAGIYFLGKKLIQILFK